MERRCRGRPHSPKPHRRHRQSRPPHLPRRKRLQRCAESWSGTNRKYRRVDTGFRSWVDGNDRHDETRSSGNHPTDDRRGTVGVGSGRDPGTVDARRALAHARGTRSRSERRPRRAP